MEQGYEAFLWIKDFLAEGDVSQEDFLAEGEVLLEYFLEEGEAMLGDFLVVLEDFLDEGEVLLEDFFLLENLLMDVKVLLENVLEESWCAAIRLPYRLRSKVRRFSCASKTFLCIKEFLLEGEVLQKTRGRRSTTRTFLWKVECC